MTAVFTEKEKKEAFGERKRLLTLWFVALGVYLALEAVMITLNIVAVVRDRDRSLYVPFMLSSIILCTLFGSGTLFFFAIKFRLTRKYCRMLRDMKQGLKDKGQGVFIVINPEISEKDGVFFYKMVIDCPPMKRGDITTREILIERNHALPAFETGDVIRFITHANILMAYEKVGHTEGKTPTLTDREKAAMNVETAVEAGAAEYNENDTTTATKETEE